MKFKLIIIFLFFLSNFILGQETTVFEKLKGVWENKGENGDIYILKFEADRIIIYEKNTLFFCRSQYSVENAWIFGDAEFDFLKIKMLEKDKFEMDILGDKLGHKRIYTKSINENPLLEIKPFVFGTEKISDSEISVVQVELAKRFKADQEVRIKKEAISKMIEVDKDNIEYLTKVVSIYGWINASRFGAEATEAAFYIVQHSNDNSLKLGILPYIEIDFKANKISGQKYAMLYDRIQLYFGRKQKYGTQLIIENGGPIVLTLVDKNKVEEFRKELGIPPLSKYLEQFEKNGVKAVFYEDKIPKDK